MANCKISLVTTDLITALNGNIEIDSVDVVNFAEGQRSIYDSQGRDVYTEVCGPWPETLEINAREKHDALHYVVECHINNLNDKYPNDPITEQTKNTGADLVKLIIADLTRGGNALITRVEGEPYYYFTGTPDAPDFVIRIDVSIEIFINIDDPYQ